MRSQAVLFSDLRARALGWLIVSAVPPLQRLRGIESWGLHVADLERLPQGSLGAELAAAFRGRDLELLPSYEPHDAIHILLDYDTTARGEICLQAFRVGNGHASLPGRTLLAIGCAAMPEWWRAVAGALRRGRASRPVLEADMRSSVAIDLGALRAGISERAKDVS